MLSCTLSQPHLARGKKYLDQKKYEQAIQELEKAANEEGDIYYYLDAYSHLGDAYNQSGQTNHAISIYRNALQIIHLRTREISSQRRALRREMNSGSQINFQGLQDTDMRLADEESTLNEKAEDIKIKLNTLTGKQ